MQYANLVAGVNKLKIKARSLNLRGYLNDHRSTGNGQEWTPEVTHGVGGVDVADITESEGYSSDGDCNREEGGSHRPP